LRIAARVTISGDRIDVDYTGTAPQVRWGINAPFNLTRAETMYALRLLFAPDVPVVEGAIAPFFVTAPEGCVLNPRRPAATMIRVTVVQNIFGALFSALAGLEQDYVPSGRLHAHFGGIWAIRFRGVYHEVPSVYRNGGPPQVNRSYAEAYFFNGGTGALGCADGRSTLSMPVNCSSIPVEIMEARTPVLFEHKRILPDSGGAGRYRGGLGQAISSAARLAAGVECGSMARGRTGVGPRRFSRIRSSRSRYRAVGASETPWSANRSASRRTSPPD
jgi:N-methylhydantoinase B